MGERTRLSGACFRRSYSTARRRLNFDPRRNTMTQLQTPVALIVFNQPDVTRRVFARIAAARPKRLLLISDAPRTDRPGEAELCDEVKRIVTAVDWPCQVETNFA